MKTDDEALRYIRETTPKLREGFARIREIREAVGVKPGEPLLGVFEPEREPRIDRLMRYLCSRPWLLFAIFVTGPLVATVIVVWLLGGYG